MAAGATTKATKDPVSAIGGAQHQHAPEPAGWKFVRHKRSGKARWSRMFLLPDDANVDGISVHLDSGVLTVNVPRCPPPPKPQPKRIPVSCS